MIRVMLALLLTFGLSVPALAEEASVPTPLTQIDSPLPGDTPAAAEPLAKVRKPASAAERKAGKKGSKRGAKASKGSKRSKAKASGKSQSSKKKVKKRK